MAQAKANKMYRIFRKVDQEMIDDILKDIKLGAPHKHAAEANGLTESMFNALIRQGIVDIQEKLSTLESNLVVSLRRIEADEIISCKDDIRFNESGHRGAEYILNKVYWRHFGDNAQMRELLEEFKTLSEDLRGNNGKATDTKD